MTRKQKYEAMRQEYHHVVLNYMKANVHARQAHIRGLKAAKRIFLGIEPPRIRDLLLKKFA